MCICNCIEIRPVEDKRLLGQLSSKRLEDNWHSGLLSLTNHRLSGRRLPIGAELEDNHINLSICRSIEVPARGVGEQIPLHRDTTISICPFVHPVESTERVSQNLSPG